MPSLTFFSGDCAFAVEPGNTFDAAKNQNVRTTRKNRSRLDIKPSAVSRIRLSLRIRTDGSANPRSAQTIVPRCPPASGRFRVMTIPVVLAQQVLAVVVAVGRAQDDMNMVFVWLGVF